MDARDFINYEALYDLTDRKASQREKEYLTETFDGWDKHDLYEICYTFCCDNFNNTLSN